MLIVPIGLPVISGALEVATGVIVGFSSGLVVLAMVVVLGINYQIAWKMIFS